MPPSKYDTIYITACRPKFTRILLARVALRNNFRHASVKDPLKKEVADQACGETRMRFLLMAFGVMPKN